MAKRTHAEFLGDEPPNRETSYDERTGACAHRINKGKTDLRRVMKLAAGLERQKAGRRRKTAKQKKDDAALARLEQEALAVKRLDLERAAEDHINKSLLRIKSIATCEALPPSVKFPSRAVVDKASLNVLARLYAADPVQKEMKKLISDIQDILGTRKGEVAGSKPVSNIVATGYNLVESKRKARANDDASDDEDYAKYISRLAASSDEDDMSDSESEDEATLSLSAKSKNAAAPRVDCSVSPPPSSDEDEKEYSDTFEGFSEPETEIKSSNRSKAAPVKSTFVPNLSSGYVSGSDSEPEYVDVDIQPRKNRRGQRARQQLAEKKFGQEAKHIKNGTSANRDKGWDLKRGAQDGSRGRNGKFRSGNAGSTRNFASDANTVELKSKVPKKDDSGPLHPSWQAAKLAKEKSQTAGFQGKKIVFD